MRHGYGRCGAIRVPAGGACSFFVLDLPSLGDFGEPEGIPPTLGPGKLRISASKFTNEFKIFLSIAILLKIQIVPY